MTNTVPWVKYEEIDNNGGRFVVEPLSRGLGTTLGNSLRRALLSSLSGSAVTSVFIEGITHEYTTLPNVIEDVLDILCNIKGIIFKSSANETKQVTLKYSGKGSVTAKELICGSELEIVNPDHHLFELSSKGKVSMTLTVDSGVGYVVAGSFKRDSENVSAIEIDASFSPVVRVNHDVGHIRIGKELDYDSLSLDIWTNGSISPEEAVKGAARLLSDKLGLFQTLNEAPVEASDAAADDSVESKAEKAVSLSIDDLELSARSSNCLKRAGIKTVSELIGKSLEDLISIKNFGAKSADEINQKLQQYGLSLKQEEPVAV